METSSHQRYQKCISTHAKCRQTGEKALATCIERAANKPDRTEREAKCRRTFAIKGDRCDAAKQNCIRKLEERYEARYGGNVWDECL